MSITTYIKILGGGRVFQFIREPGRPSRATSWSGAENTTDWDRGHAPNLRRKTAEADDVTVAGSPGKNKTRPPGPIMP